MDLLDELTWRGLLHQSTDEAGLRDHLKNPNSTPRRIYAGFDPTADSLTIGNLVPIMLLKHIQRAGHDPIVVMGGGTGLIGDPSGKSAERQLMTSETVACNIEKQRPIFSRILGQDVTILNNADWLTKISFIDALRDIGKYFSVNMMMQKDSVRARLQNRQQGITYTEFSYMILQAYDFEHLYEKEDVTAQCGGSDQYGNIVAGVSLVRKLEISRAFKRLAQIKNNAVEFLTTSNEPEFRAVAAEHRLIHGPSYNTVQEIMDANLSLWERMVSSDKVLAAIRFDLPSLEREWEYTRERVRRLTSEGDSTKFAFGFTAPLVTKADGSKFGKTESGAIWLTAERTSPYAYYQFWLNASDCDVGRFLRTFTLLDRQEIERLEAEVAANPAAREAQKALAYEATSLLHGEAEADAAIQASKALFADNIASLPEATLLQVLADVPTSRHDISKLDGGISLVELLIETELAKSKRQAREFLCAGSVNVNGTKANIDTCLSRDDLLHNSLIAIRRGKKNRHLTIWE